MSADYEEDRIPLRFRLFPSFYAEQLKRLLKDETKIATAVDKYEGPFAKSIYDAHLLLQISTKEIIPSDTRQALQRIVWAVTDTLESAYKPSSSPVTTPSSSAANVIHTFERIAEPLFTSRERAQYLPPKPAWILGFGIFTPKTVDALKFWKPRRHISHKTSFTEKVLNVLSNRGYKEKGPEWSTDTFLGEVYFSLNPFVIVSKVVQFCLILLPTTVKDFVRYKKADDDPTAYAIGSGIFDTIATLIDIPLSFGARLVYIPMKALNLLAFDLPLIGRLTTYLNQGFHEIAKATPAAIVNASKAVINAIGRFFYNVGQAITLGGFVQALASGLVDEAALRLSNRLAKVRRPNPDKPNYFDDKEGGDLTAIKKLVASYLTPDSPLDKFEKWLKENQFQGLHTNQEKLTNFMVKILAQLTSLQPTKGDDSVYEFFKQKAPEGTPYVNWLYDTLLMSKTRLLPLINQHFTDADDKSLLLVEALLQPVPETYLNEKITEKNEQEESPKKSTAKVTTMLSAEASAAGIHPKTDPKKSVEEEKKKKGIKAGWANAKQKVSSFINSTENTRPRSKSAANLGEAQSKRTNNSSTGSLGKY